MPTTELKLEFEVSSSEGKGIPVIIAAAGSSSRMLGINKQFALLRGIPVLARTMLAFERSNIVSKIIVVASKENIADVEKLAQKYMIDKLLCVVEGGQNRAESVKNGLALLPSCAQYVLVHDGARPLVNNKIIKAVADKLKTSDAVTCAVALKDTVKKIDENGVVIETPSRKQLVAVQTPQGLNIKKYREAIETVKDLSVFTDDMSIMEAAGYSPAIVRGSYKNIKITTPEDIKVAEIFIESEEE